MRGVYNATSPLLTDGRYGDHQLDVSGNLKTVASVADANGTVTQPALSSTFWQYAAVAGGIVNSTADVAIKAAAGAGVRNFLSSLVVPHDALGAASEYVIKDGATVIYRGKAHAAMTEGVPINFDPPLRGTANTALNFALITLTVTGGTFVNAQGYTGA